MTASDVQTRGSRGIPREREKASRFRVGKPKVLRRRFSRHETPFNSARSPSRQNPLGESPTERKRTKERTVGGRERAGGISSRESEICTLDYRTTTRQSYAKANGSGAFGLYARKLRASAYTHTACTPRGVYARKHCGPVMHCLGRLMHRAAQFVRVNNDRLQ